MSDATGAASKAAFTKDSGDHVSLFAYPYPGLSYTPTALGAGDQLPFLNESLTTVQDNQPDETLTGGAGVSGFDLISNRTTGMLKCRGWYDNDALMELILCAMGFENPNTAANNGSPQLLGSGVSLSAYAHIFELDQRLERQAFLAGEERLPGPNWHAGDRKVRSGMLGIAKGVSDWRYQSSMVNRMTIRITPAMFEFDFDLVAYSRDLGDYSSGSWAFTSAPKYKPLFSNLEVKLGTVTSGVGFDWQTIGVSEISIVLDNKLVVGDQDSSTGLYIKEPARDGKRTIEVSINLARHQSDKYLNQLDNSRLMKMWVKFDGPAIADTGQDFAFNVYLPALIFTDGQAQISGPGLIKPDYKLAAQFPTSNPFSGELAGIDLKKGDPVAATGSEMWMKLVNRYGNNYLTGLTYTGATP